MPTIAEEIKIVRELAKRYMEIAVSDRHVRMRARFRDSNDLKPVRPPLIMEEIPWHEMNTDGELDCVCQDQTLKNMEWFFRMQLYREKHFRCDNYIEPVWTVGKSFRYPDGGMFGFEADDRRLIIDPRNNISSHHYEDMMEDESCLENYRDPVITAEPEKDRANVEKAQEILGQIMPVELRGTDVYYPPWDRIARLRGVEPILMDMYDRPEYLHRIMALFTRGMALEMDQMEALGLYDDRGMNIHCTPKAVTVAPEKEKTLPRGRALWFRTMAQMFSSVSPDAHVEFDIQYSVPLSKRCAYTYYGCCEPLHDRIDRLRLYPNLRKVGVSPWADVEKSAEAIGRDLVLSRKPNPANVAISTDPAVVRAEIEETAKLCIRYGCACDITLKDISTVSYRPQNLYLWAETASRVLDEYYGPA